MALSYKIGGNRTIKKKELNPYLNKFTISKISVNCRNNPAQIPIFLIKKNYLKRNKLKTYKGSYSGSLQMLKDWAFFPQFK